MSASLPDRVLVVRLGAIGDVVNALVFATALKDAKPSLEIGWAVHPLARPLVEHHPSVDRVHLWERGKGLGELRRLVRELRSERYELAVDLQRLQKSSFLARCSGAPRVLGYDRARAKEQSWIWTRERIAAGPAHAHMVEHYLSFARHLGLADARARHVLPVDEEAERWAEAYVADLGAPPVLVNLGTTKAPNRWPAERFGELARCLRERTGAPVVLTGSRADAEAGEQAMRAAGGGSNVVSSIGQTDLLQLVSLQRRARLFVACDTGPMHMAVAVGLPTLALFGPADPRRTGPFGAVDEEGRSLPGTHRVVRPDGAPAPMEQLTVERVLASALELVQPATEQPQRLLDSER